MEGRRTGELNGLTPICSRRLGFCQLGNYSLIPVCQLVNYPSNKYGSMYFTQTRDMAVEAGFAGLRRGVFIGSLLNLLVSEQENTGIVRVKGLS
jgi:hypothetical protein